MSEESNRLATTRTVRDELERLDHDWDAFRKAVARFPRERLDQPIEGGWSLKQMLAHVAAWHENAGDRLLHFQKTGAQCDAEPVDAFNARVARAASGRTSGEVLDALDASFRRLRRQLSQLSDAQLAAHAGWAASVVAENSYEHYDEHLADVQRADLSSTP